MSKILWSFDFSCYKGIYIIISPILSFGSQKLNIFIIWPFTEKKLLTPALNCSNHWYTYILIFLLFSVFMIHIHMASFFLSFQFILLLFLLKRNHSSGKKFISDMKSRSSKIKPCHFNFWLCRCILESEEKSEINL